MRSYYSWQLQENTDISYILQDIRRQPARGTLLELQWRKNNSKKIISIVEALPTHITSLSLFANDLTNESRELTSIIQALPAHITSLAISVGGFTKKNRGPDDLKSILPALQHLSLRSLGLHGNYLGNKAIDELISTMQALKHYAQNLTSLDLSDNVLGNITGAELKRIMEPLPPNLGSLNLSYNKLGNMTGAELTSFMEGVPRNLKSLNLSNNNLSKLTTDELISMMQVLPPNLESLDLSNNDLSKLTTDELISIMQALPRNLKSLNLSGYVLGNKTGAELKRIMEVLPPSLVSLDISSNIGRWMNQALHGAGLKEMIQGLPRNLTSLDLDGNSLYGTGTELKEMMEALPTTLESLSVLDCGLAHGPELKDIIKALPTHLKSLNLSLDCRRETSAELKYVTKDLPQLTSLMLSLSFGDTIPVAELKEMMEVLPTSLTSLHLGNNFRTKTGELTKEELMQLLAAIPASVTTLIYNHNDDAIFSKASYLQRQGYNFNQARAMILNPNEVIGLSAGDTKLPRDAIVLSQVDAIVLSYLSPIPEKDATLLLEIEQAHQEQEKACQEKLEEINSACQKYLELLLAGKKVGSLDSKTKKQYDEIREVLRIISNDFRSSIKKKEELAELFQNTQFCEALSTPKKSRLLSFFSKETPDSQNKGAEFVKNIQDLLEIKPEAQQMRPL